MIDIQDILCVLAVAEEKSITKAAANLFLTQSAVSQKITRVEKELGMKVKVEREGSVICFKNWMPLLRKSSIKGEIGPIYNFWYLTT